MRAMTSILIGFLLGFLLLGTAVEWVLNLAAGRCGVGCAGWRHVVFVAVTAIAWAVVARLTYLVWGRISPRPASPGMRGLIRRLIDGETRRSADLDAILRHRTERDRFLAEDYASPLPEEHREGFRGLDYFPPNQAWVITGAYEAIDPRDVPITSSAGTESPYKMVGTVMLPIGRSEYRLIVLDDGDGCRFIPFRDRTCGDTTYSGGRYVGIELSNDGTVIVDFNRARNPWCVYDEEFTCPLPPPGNAIAEPIAAGEKMWRIGG